ncbi:MAG: OmpH family outer membrane protein [Flavobacteriales bacterium]|nr:OmpH family outer membrane protein [Flavobacteriales bacterium]
MKKELIIIGSLVLLLITSCSKTEKTGYIKMGELFEAFELKKQLTGQLEQTVNARKNVLDSLKLNLEMMVAGIKANETNDSLKQAFLFSKEQYLAKQQQFESENQQLQQQYDNQIWTQLNEYVENYGQEQQLGYIFGANGSGAIMYGKESNDITQEVIKYVNQKFVGK